MSLFRKFNEEDYLDIDEIRLRRESEARTRRVHKECAADHRDDYIGSFAPKNNTKPHDNCKADHKDDKSNDAARLVLMIVAITTVVFFLIIGVIIASVFMRIR